MTVFTVIITLWIITARWFARDVARAVHEFRKELARLEHEEPETAAPRFRQDLPPGPPPAEM